MKLYTVVTPSHRHLFDHWFRPSVTDEYDLVVDELTQPSGGCHFMQAGWLVAVRHKVLQLIRAAAECDGDIFVYSDVDVQFFRPTAAILRSALGAHDLACQRDSPDGRLLCSGFFACRGNDRTRLLWQSVLDVMDRTGKNDQDALNALRSSIRYVVLPIIFWGPGCQGTKLWVPGRQLRCPRDIVLHHANWTVGIRNKEAQLAAVKQQVASWT